MLSPILHGWRSWKSAKAIALLAIAALSVGIGSSTAIYTVVHSVLLNPIPYRNGERFVALFGIQLGESGISAISWLDLLDYQQRARTFDLFGIYQPREFNLTAPGQPRHLLGVEVSPSLANGLGVMPVAGTWFSNADPVNRAVISSGLWKELGGNTAIVGQTVTLDGTPYTVTGVMPAWFRFPISGTSGEEIHADVWVPLNPQGPDRRRDVASYFCYARLKPGITIAAADADVKRIAAQLARERGGNPKNSAVVNGVRDAVANEIRPTLLLLFGAAVALLLLTFSNVAGLLLARSVVRTRDTAIQLALGATAAQLASQYFVEGLLIAFAGAAGGVIASFALVRFVLAMAADYIPRASEIGVDWSAVGFAVTAAFVASLLFSLAPLWQAARAVPREALTGLRASAGAHTQRLSRSLVVVEIALAFTLLAAGALLLAHLDRLRRTGPGFDPDRLLTFSMSINPADYMDFKRRIAYQQRLVQSVEHIPGVTAAAFVNQLPLQGCCIESSFAVEGQPPDPKGLAVNLLFVSPDYFTTMRIPLLKGRLFDRRDWTDEQLPGVIVDEALAKRYWAGRNAVGAYAQIASQRVRVGGIVANVRNHGLGADTTPELYMPATVFPVSPMHFTVRTAMPMSAAVPAIRAAIHQADPSAPIYGISTMREILEGSVVSQRLQSLLTSFFAVAALLMAALGIYGVVSYSVRSRTVEIGTRIALGAMSRDLVTSIVGEGLRMAGYGILTGGAAVLAVALLLRSQVFGVQIGDPRPFLLATGIVAGCSALACLLPAWRATLVSPMVAIRDDPGSLWRSVKTKAAQMLSSADAEAEADEQEMLAEFVDSSRRAASFREAVEASLAMLRDRLHCEWAALLSKDEQGAFAGGSYGIPGDGLLARRLRNNRSPLPLSEGDFDAWSRWAKSERPDRIPEIDVIRSTHAALAVPLLAKDELAGILLLSSPAGRDRYSAAEKNVLRNCAAQFALMLENARLTSRMIEQEKLRRDMQLAADVQQRLFPDKAPATALVTFAGLSLPARGVGGDYYDFLDLGDGRIGIALADVAGKGVPAALIMSVVQASLRILAEERTPLPELAQKMNRFLHRSTKSNAYATFFYGQVDERARQLRYVNAGHNPPYLLQYVAPHEIQELPAGGTVIGLFPQSSYDEAVVDLCAGDVLIAFTDGVPEALNPAEEEFGEDRIKVLLRQWAHLSVDEMAAQIAAELKAWIADAAQYDDLTFILMKVKGD